MDDRHHREALVSMAAGVEALRLNRHYPPRDVVVAYLEALALEPGVRWSETRGMPTGDAWLALDVAREEAVRSAAGWAALQAEPVGTSTAASLAGRRARQERLAILGALPVRQIEVQLRNRVGSRASYQVVLDRFDLATTTLARYTLVLEDVPGAHVTAGELELEARGHFAEALHLLDGQDAALAFAVLAGRVVAVHEVVRGVIGPMFVRTETGSVGPTALGDAGARVVVSARLERASVDVERGRIDDPLAASVVLPTDAGFGLSRTAKFAVEAHEVASMRAWVKAQGSRALVYGWGSR